MGCLRGIPISPIVHTLLHRFEPPSSTTIYRQQDPVAVGAAAVGVGVVVAEFAVAAGEIVVVVVVVFGVGSTVPVEEVQLMR